MKNKEFAAYGRDLLSTMTGFGVKGPLIYAEPATPILRGIAFEGSRSRENFYIWVFYQPLCVPVDYIVFNCGFRLQDRMGSDYWSSDRPSLIPDIAASLVKSAHPFLQPVATYSGAAEACEAMQSDNPNIQEAAAYCRVMAGENDSKALKQLDNILPGLDLTIPWKKDLADRVRHIVDLVRSDPAAARLQLREWEAGTLAALKNNNHL